MTPGQVAYETYCRERVRDANDYAPDLPWSSPFVDRAAWESEWGAALRRRVRSASARVKAPRAPESAAIVTPILIGGPGGVSAVVEPRRPAAGPDDLLAN